MLKLTTVTEKRVEQMTKTYIIGIHIERGRYLVRKSELIAGMRVPLFETYVLDADRAVWMQQQLINEINGFSLN